MVSKPTVFVVGAGGSIPYGFPSGQSLTREIVSSLTVNMVHTPLGKLLLECGEKEASLDRFGRALMLSGQVSIDAFLERRGEFADLGKLVIAAAIGPKENEGLFLSAPDDANWYRYLFNRLSENLKRGDAMERLDIVTFNYDRSLEHFLYTAFQHSFGKDDAATRSLLSKLRVIHVHGMLGELPLFARAGRSPRAYGLSRPEAIVAAAQSIRIVHEAAESDAEFVEARRVLGLAQRICFLGFGYGRDNVQRLLGPWIDNSTPPAIVGTNFGLTKAESNEAESLLQGKVEFLGGSYNCLSFLRERVNLIR
jgi:hypothetical protein